MNSLINLSPKQLRRAADLQEKIQAMQQELTELLGADPQPPTANGAPAKRQYRWSRAGLARLRKAAKARWAKKKAQPTSS